MNKHGSSYSILFIASNRPLRIFLKLVINC
jgi:hypothetical protein